MSRVKNFKNFFETLVTLIHKSINHYLVVVHRNNLTNEDAALASSFCLIMMQFPLSASQYYTTSLCRATVHGVKFKNYSNLMGLIHEARSSTSSQTN